MAYMAYKWRLLTTYKSWDGPPSRGPWSSMGGWVSCQHANIQPKGWIQVDKQQVDKPTNLLPLYKKPYKWGEITPE